MNARGYSIVVVLYTVCSFFVQAAERNTGFLDTEDAACLSEEEENHPDQNKCELFLREKENAFVMVPKEKSARSSLPDNDDDVSSEEEGVGYPMPQTSNNGYRRQAINDEKRTTKLDSLQFIARSLRKLFPPNTIMQASGKK